MKREGLCAILSGVAVLINGVVYAPWVLDRATKLSQVPDGYISTGGGGDLTPITFVGAFIIIGMGLIFWGVQRWRGKPPAYYPV